jgi:cytochrome P450
VSTDHDIGEERKDGRLFHFDRHAADYREHFASITEELQQKCPVAWTQTYGGHWVAAGNREVFELARSANTSNDADFRNERRGYQGVTIPSPEQSGRKTATRGGFLEMDPPEQKAYRQALNAYLSPAAIKRWIPFVDEIVRACIDEKIESGRIDFVDDMANVVPAVLTLAVMGIPLKKWEIYCEPAHASIYTPPNSPDMQRVMIGYRQMIEDLRRAMLEIRETPRPGLIDAVNGVRVDGQVPPEDDLVGVLLLLIGGGFDTTTALTGNSLAWLSEHPAERERLSRERESMLDSATEEFLRFFAPAPGDARTISADCAIAGVDFREGDRVWLSWAMANRDPSIFEAPNTVDLDRRGNRHYSFGLGIHRCIGSNLARTVFKRMLVHVLDRMPDYRCDPAGTVYYDTIGVINGVKHLPATFTPGPRLGAGLSETLETLQALCTETGLSEPVTAGAGDE